MKKIVFILCALFMALVCVPVFGQEIEIPADVAGLGFETFAGIVAIVSFFLTQGAKFIPFVEKNTITKIVSSVVIAVVISLVAWQFKLAAFLADMALWQVAIQGALIGLSACGFFDVLKSVGLVKK